MTFDVDRGLLSTTRLRIGGSVTGMRWDRLFADLEGAAEDAVREERDALAEELRDELWAERSWIELVGGPVVLRIVGCGELRGEVVDASDQLLRLVIGTGDEVLVAAAAVASIRGGGRQLALRRTGWTAAFRAMRDAGEIARVVLRDGHLVEAPVRAVARDAVVLDAGPPVVIPWSGIALVRR